MIKIFLDANVLVDILDGTRESSRESGELFARLVQGRNKYLLYTSCDLLTTIYYFTKKPLGKNRALEKIKTINQIMKVVAFGNSEIEEAIILMQRNEKYTDLEDTIQYVIARKEKCDYIVTNDKLFASGDIPLLSSREALKVFKGS